MRVLHVIPSLSTAHGGPSRAIRLIEDALLGRGITVETATTDDDGPGLRTGKRCAVLLAENGRARRYFPKRMEFYKVSPGFARWIFGHVRDYDLVHIHALFSFTSVVAAWAARKAGVPYVVRPLGTLNRYGVKQRRPWLKRLSLKLIEGPILRHAAAVHFTAMAEQMEAGELGFPLRAVVIPLGIEPTEGDASVFLARYPELLDYRVLLYLSRLDPKKNIESLLRAFSQIVGLPRDGVDLVGSPLAGRGGLKPALQKYALSDVRLVIAGNGVAGYVASLKKLADELQISDKVLWTGNLNGELKAGAFAAAQIFVLPSFSENFGIAAAEALMAGLPCVLGEGVAIADEVAKGGAGLVTAPDPKAIAQAVQTLLGDDNSSADMGRCAAVLARERYSLAAMGASLHALYSKILTQKSPRLVE